MKKTKIIKIAGIIVVFVLVVVFMHAHNQLNKKQEKIQTTQISKNIASKTYSGSPSMAEAPGLMVPADDIEVEIISAIDIPEIEQSEKKVESKIEPEKIAGPQDTITFAGGCFWCIEAFFQEEPGVVSAISGYSGGDPDRTVYKQVVKGDTGHREVVQVIYDTAQVSLERIMGIFWTQIDPTDPNGQFADDGFQYTTAIYYHNDEQKLAAEKSLQSLRDSGLFKEAIVTKILPFESFFKAEEYHQDYYQKSALRYNAYKKASGRTGFIEEEWAKQAALEFLGQVEKEKEVVFEEKPVVGKKHWDDYTDTDIQKGLLELDAETYRIVAKDGTEPSFENKYWDHKEPGVYVDVVTGEPLFSSTHKYDSNTGWPSFWQGISQDSFDLEEDTKLTRTRIEVRSRSGHLGHVFGDGPEEHGGQRYCINSAALHFIAQGDMADEGYSDYMYLFN